MFVGVGTIILHLASGGTCAPRAMIAARLLAPPDSYGHGHRTGNYGHRRTLASNVCLANAITLYIYHAR
eukprot:3503614-Pleurochrysis_carterae.AAC.1